MIPIVGMFSDFDAIPRCALREEKEINTNLLIFIIFNIFSIKGILLIKTTFEL